MPPSLDAIVAVTRERLSQRRAQIDLRALDEAASKHTPRGFRNHLNHVSQDGIAAIAELKKASPSKGLIRDDFRPAALASELADAGAAALSVLTEEEFFQGALDYLREASEATSLPCLRKDFIIDEFQIVEARANRADAMLLIVAALTDKELRLLAASASAHGLDVLCEAHDEQELDRALDAGCDLIGINSRNLRTFEVSLDTALRLAEKVPSHCMRVAESGIFNGVDVARLRAAGCDAFLIGESLMREKHPGEALRRLLRESILEVESSGLETRGSKLPL